MASLYSGLSGLKAQQEKLDVISNNIANLSTTAYKAQSVTFSDLLSQTLSGATAASSTKGGTNAIQVGLGVSVAATTINMSIGSTQTTGNATDLSISGDGFFIVQGGTTGEYQFTRDGNFSVDASGNLTVNGYLVCGWQDYAVDDDGNYVFDTQKSVEAINLLSDSYNGNKKIIAPQATTAAALTGNLTPSADATGTALDDIGTVPDTASATTTMEVYDAQGNKYDVQVKLYKCYTDSTTNTTSYYWEVDSSDTSSLAVSGASGYVEFDSNGKIITTDTTNYNVTPTITLTPQGSYAGAAAFTVDLDLSNLSYYTASSNSGISVKSIDGYAAGELQEFSIGADGVIYGVYSNGESQPLGMIALAAFNNSSGLQKIGDNLYAATANSGAFTGGIAAGTGGTGSLSSGTLEMSNVDLSEQLSEMMVAQRAYQANSKVITTTDNMMEVVINMLR